MMGVGILLFVLGLADTHLLSLAPTTLGFIGVSLSIVGAGIIAHTETDG